MDHFTDDDKKKIVEFLNFIAERAVFPDWKTEDSIKHFKMLAFMQQVLIPKIDAHIFEIKRVVEPSSETKE